MLVYVARDLGLAGWIVRAAAKQRGELRLFKGSGDALRGAEGVSPAGARLAGLRRSPGAGVAGGNQPPPFAARPRAAGGGARSARLGTASLRGSAPPTCEKQSGLSTRCRKSSDLCSM